jgi:hypothetical protein
MTRSVAAVELALANKREEHRNISREIRTLEDELKEARLADAAANPHPWIGKKVQRKVLASSYRRGAGTKIIRGTLQVKQQGKYYRGNAAGVGELIVVTDSGLTAYEFPARSGETQWELAS